MRENTGDKWHVSKSVPVVFILAVAMQTGAIIWGAAKLDTRVQSIEEWIKTNSSTQVDIAKHYQMIEELSRRLAFLERKL